MFWGVAARNYEMVYNIVIWLLCMFLCLGYMQSPNNNKLLHPNSSLPALVLTIIVTLFLGLRPDNWYWFGDSYLYAHTYNNIVSASNDFNIDMKSEWFFLFVNSFCKFLHLDVRIFFLVVAIFYIVLMFIACQILLWENVWMAMLFCLSSFSFYTFGVNGIRSGMATSLVLLGIALLARNHKKFLPISLFIFLLAFGTHRSMVLPVVSTIAALYFVKKPKYAIYLWCGSIIVSLAVGGSVQSLLVNIIGAEDNRMTSYATFDAESQFAHTGFRWDFVLYSSVPVILTYYMAIKRGIQDKTYYFLANIYMISNAFWILVIRMAYTNRIAYLSWFMYPLVLAYAVIRVHIWEDQDKKAGWFLLGHTCFTLIMFLLGK